ncbi:unnamed protein product, partial [marine sediment metagenome]
ADWTTPGPGRLWTMTSGLFPTAALAYYNGTRARMVDCLMSLSVAYTGGQGPIGTASVFVGSVVDAIAGAVPTTDYGNQADVSAVPLQDAAFTWGALRGFDTATLAINLTTQEFGDCNAPTGTVVSKDDTEVAFTAQLRKDDANLAYEAEQLQITDAGDQDPMSFQLGEDGVALGAATAIQHRLPEPELQEDTFGAIGSEAADSISMVGRGSTPNSQVELIFR